MQVCEGFLVTAVVTAEESTYIGAYIGIYIAFSYQHHETARLFFSDIP